MIPWTFACVRPSPSTRSRRALFVTPLAAARAEPVTLRLATIAPHGTGWAREFAALARDIELGTQGAVRVKMYYSAIGGDEFTVLDRIKRDQLDGAIGSESCVRVAPSLRVTRIFGLFQNRDESFYVLGRLERRVDAEFLRAGFVNLGDVTLGAEMLFTRAAGALDWRSCARRSCGSGTTTMRSRLQAPALGLHVVGHAARGRGARLRRQERRRLHRHADGGAGLPVVGAGAATSRTSRSAIATAASFIASRAFDALPIDAQRYIRSADGASCARASTTSAARQDDALVGGLFARQGLKTVPVSDAFRLDFFREARDMRVQLGAQLVRSEAPR